MRFLRNLKFWKRVTLVCMIPILIISTFIGVMSYTQAKKTASRNSESSIFDAVNRVDMSLTTRSQQINSAAEVIVQNIFRSNLFYNIEDEGKDLLRGTISPFQEIISATVFCDGTEWLTTDAERIFYAEQIEFFLSRPKNIQTAQFGRVF